MTPDPLTTTDDDRLRDALRALADFYHDRGAGYHRAAAGGGTPGRDAAGGVASVLLALGEALDQAAAGDAGGLADLGGVCGGWLAAQRTPVPTDPI